VSGLAAPLTFWGPVFALLSSVTWAVGSTEYAKLSRTHSGFAVNFSRAFTALPIFLVTALMASMLSHSAGGYGLAGAFADFRELRPSHLRWFTISILSSYAMGDVCLYWSARRLGIPVALTIASTYPLLTTSWGILVHGERLSWIQFSGLLITLIGVSSVILLAPREVAISDTNTTLDAGSGGGGKRDRMVGVAFAVATSVLWAINSYAVRIGGQTVSAAVGNTVRMALALVFCFAVGRILEPKARIMLPWVDYRRKMWVFVVESFGGSYFFMYGLSHSSLAVGSTLVSLAPVISVPFAWSLGMEKFSLGRTLGVLAAVTGLWLLLGGVG
jgi:drug/metabolite transporter (DMT)-like permease